MTDELTAIRYLCLGAPAALLAVALLTSRQRTDRAGAGLAFIAAFVGIAAVHELALAAGWYAFTPVAGAYRGLPVDAWLGWAVLWGPLPVLLRRWLPLPVALGLLLWLDLVSMPRLEVLVTLGPHWVHGEVAGLVAVALPAQLLGRWTADRSRLRARVALQLAVFTGLVLWLLPSVAFAVGDGSWAALTANLPLLAQVGLLLAVPGLAAVQEFAIRGGGTPFPWDPPRRLVTTGPYAYLANPMQVSAVALLLLLALAAGSVTLAAAACTAVAFAAGVAAPHEREQLARRYGPQWHTYRRSVRPWWPRLHPYRPAAGAVATLWLDAGCPACRAAARLLHGHRSPLRIAPAHRHTRTLWRARYEDADGTTDSGVGAVARGLEHLGLGWAYLGWLLRLPGVRALAQVVTDALIAPPHPARAPQRRGEACPRPDPTRSGGCSTGRSAQSGSTASPAPPPAASPPPPE